MADKCIEKLVQLFEFEKNNCNSIPMKKYMRDQFDFLGIKTPLRRELTKQVFKELKAGRDNRIHDFVKMLWQFAEREYRYFAVDYLDKYKKNFDVEDVELLEHMITNKPWWDTVDLIASKLVGYLFMKYPYLIEDYAEKWIVSDNMWLRRTAILFQLKYKEKTDQELLFRYILLNAEDKQFFVQKAIGWALREYSKIDEVKVREFISNNELMPLSVREGMKVINR